jgi:hypothetical protein
MVPAFPHAALDDVPLVAEASGGETKLTSEVREVLAADVAQLDVLEVGPDALVGVQIWSVAREPLQLEPAGGSLGQEVLDRLAAMDRCTIPDDQELAGDVAEQMLEKADDVWALVRSLLHLQEQPPVRSDATDDREVIPAQRQSEDGCLAAWGIGPDGGREQVEAGLVDPDDGSPLLVSPLFRAGQRSVRHASIAASFRWLARWTGFWTLQPAARKRLPT